jgi:predicted nucleic acid-binding protein
VSARRIVNASPLILLSKAGRLELLRVGAGEVVVPDAVHDEIGAKGPDDPTVQAVAAAAWLTVVPAGVVPDAVAACRLDRGETSVLALAHGQTDCEVVLDDLAARRAAAALGITCVGTLGVVLLARHGGVIAAVRPVVEELQRVGLYLDDDFVAELLKRIGE